MNRNMRRLAGAVLAAVVVSSYAGDPDLPLSGYEGEFRDGVPHGQGVITAPDGRRYEGDVRYGRPSGRGIQTWPDGACYEGNFEAGERHGYGAMTYPNGRRLVGTWDWGEFKGQHIETRHMLGAAREELEDLLTGKPQSDEGEQ